MSPTELTAKDFTTDQEVRWCPGCGDYSILKAVQNVFPTLGIPREKFVVVSGIGCSSRFPYYMDTFGFHTIHGRAPAVATGVKLANPELSVWIATGDGDALSIGGNHLIHAMRRNLDVKILMFNNRIYGLTKGQYSPTSEVGKVTKSTPFGSVDRPFNPLALAIGSGATFVARTIDIMVPHLKATIEAAARHKGTAFVEIFQNCNVFNDGAFASVTEKTVRDDALVDMQDHKPLVFGKDHDKALRLNGLKAEVVGASESDLWVHDETDTNTARAYVLSQLGQGDGTPTPIGVFCRREAETFDGDMVRQVENAKAKNGPGDLQALLTAGDTWTVGAKS
ncbi:MAG: 2-oxoacid:ferredoxin oxidoreductase subunit beta [Planctomycetota bacterium]